jgi:signal transduction histidine kinase
MQLSSEISTQTLGLSFGDRISAESRLRPRMTVSAAQSLAWAAVAPMVAVTMWLALTSDHLQRPWGAGLYWGYLIAASMLIGLFWWRRRPASRFGPLLVVSGVLTWVASWQGANAPLAFDIGVLAEGPFFVLTFYLFLAFPMGRVEPRAARWLLGLLIAGVVGFFLPWALFTPVIAGGGPLTACAPDCPENVLQIGTAPTLVDVAGHAETYTGLVIAIGVLVVYIARLLSASRPQRRALMAVAVTSLLFVPAWFVFNFAAWILELGPATLSTLAWGIVATRVLLPLGFLIALLQADRFAATCLGALLERLVARPTPRAWRATVARVLDDDSLQLGYYDPAQGHFREPDGRALQPPSSADRVWVPIVRGDQPVAAMVIEETLTADPELVRAAGFATLLAIENGTLEGELHASRARILDAGHAERRRIERDLHDGAQQRLVALRIRLGLVGDQLERSPERAMIEQLGADVEETIDELRNLAHGVYPQLLDQFGLRVALDAVARRFVLPVAILDGEVARHSAAIETAVYFCCLESLQNAAKHAGPGASVTVRLGERDGRVTFSVEDDGVGFDPGDVERGAGLTNLSDRLTAVGGTLQVDSRPGRGTRITGSLPVQPDGARRPTS